MAQETTLAGTAAPEGGTPRSPRELPHGLIAPSEEVRAIVKREKARFPASVFTADAEERLLCELTLQSHFEQLGYEVLYGSTPDGPVVIAVGDQERLSATQGMSPEECQRFKTWLP